MNKILKIIAYAVSFGAGFGVGYYLRKRSEMQFEIVSEEELNAEAEKDTQNTPETASEAPVSPSEVDIEREIAKTFERTEEASESQGEGIGNGQKIAYFRQWKAEEAREKYDTRTKEEPEEPVTETEEGLDKEFLDGLEEDIANLPEIEAGTIEDWYIWVGKPDGRYDPIELYWYERDDQLVDTHEKEVERAELFVGFDIGKKFEEIDSDTTGDPNVRVLFNHRRGIIYHITRINGSWALKKKAEEFGSEEDDEDEDIYDRFRQTYR